ncbi:hypothetical protein OFN63_29395, partial [Escherichia coli]|nr:hypothetical protein [Escherichia coli]
MIEQTKPLLNLSSEKQTSLVDQAIMFSILRGFSVRPKCNGIQPYFTGWQPLVKRPTCQYLSKERIMKQRTNKLFEPAQLKALSLQNRIVMAPMT